MFRSMLITLPLSPKERPRSRGESGALKRYGCGYASAARTSAARSGRSTDRMKRVSPAASWL